MEKFTETQSSKAPRLVEIARVADPRGNLSFVQHPGACPFEIERVYWLYDVPADSVRHGRALRKTDELIVPMSGAFDVTVDAGDGLAPATYHLDRCFQGLYVPAGTWRSISRFVTNSVAMVLASTTYDEADYIADYDEFITYKQTHND